MATQLTLAVILFLFSHHCILSSSQSLTTKTGIKSPSGAHSIPISLLRRHLPSFITHPSHNLSDYLFEHKRSTDHILSTNGDLHIPSLSPRTIQPPPAHRYIVNNKILDPPHTQGATIHMGEHHVFIHDYQSGVLLAAWGPKLNLKPLHFKRFPSLFVNVYHHEHMISSKSIHALQPSNKNSKSQLQNNHHRNEQGHFIPQWGSEHNIFFDVGLGFDKSFCTEYESDPYNATSLAHSIGVTAHEMSLTPIVSLRVGDVIGFCEGNSTNSVRDVFAPPSPKKIKSCKKKKFKCSVPELRLNTFRNSWSSYVNDSILDAAYLLTSSSIIRKGDVVGAAWVASACSEFGFGYLLGNHPIILAHEMGHTLGAAHSTSGLMRPYLSLNDTKKYTDKSLIAIDNFIYRISGQSCLVPRHEDNNRNRFSGFTRLVRAGGKEVEGSDVAVGKVRKHGQVLVVMMQVEKHLSTGAVRAALRVTTLYRSAEYGFPFSYTYSYLGVHVRNSHILDFRAGAGLAIASLRDDRYDDVISVVVDRTKNRFFYVVGYGIEQGESRPILSSQSSGRAVPIPIHGDILCVGSAAGDMRGIQQNDLIISYIEHNKNQSSMSVKYIIGYNIDGVTVMAKDGWSAPVEIIIPESLKIPIDPECIGDVSVALWPSPSSNELEPITSTSLLFSIITKSKTTKEWNTFVCVVYNAHNFRKWNSTGTSSLNCYKPGIKPLRSNKLTGGIALTRLLSSTSPVATSIIYQGRSFDEASSSTWIDVGDGVLTNEQAIDPAQPRQLALSIGEEIIPQDTCSRCYNKKDVKKCEKRLNSCFAHRNYGKLEKVHATSIRRTVRLFGDDLSPKSDSIFCAGFHSIFVSQRSSTNSGDKKCKWDSKRTSIIAEGVRVLLLSHAKIKRSVYKIEMSRIPKSLRYILEGGGFGNNFIPSSIRVTVFSAKHIRYDILNRAMNKIKKKPDFNSFFSSSTKGTKIVRKGRKKYLVIFKFKREYQAAFLRDIASGRTSHY